MTNAIEQTKREMYTHLESIKSTIKKGFSPISGVQNFEPALEAHLEELRKDAAASQARIGELYAEVQQWKDIAAARQQSYALMLQDRDGIQQRLHAIDHAYCEQSNRVSTMDKMIDNLSLANQVAGEELRKAQEQSRIDRQDLISAEKCSDDFSEKLTHATTVIGQQEQLIVGQRLAIADLYLAGRRLNSAVATLQRLGYTDHGGQLWKPPIGKKPEFEQCCHEFHPAFPGGERCIYCCEPR